MWALVLAGFRLKDLRAYSCLSRSIPRGYAVLEDGSFVHKLPNPTSTKGFLRYRIDGIRPLSELSSISIDELQRLPSDLRDEWWSTSFDKVEIPTGDEDVAPTRKYRRKRR